MLVLRKYFLYFSLIFCTLLVIFPEIDIAVSGRFFEQGVGFKYKNHDIAVGIFKLVPSMTKLWVGGLVVFITYKIVSLRNAKQALKIPAIFLIISAMMGPGLAINYVLKENWGRARPNVVTEFGGDKKFTRAGAISDQCKSNCSFSSGHASMGYHFTSLAWVVPIYLQNITFIVTFLFGTMVGVGRVAQGGHFLSDITFSFLITMIINHAIYGFWLYLQRKYTKQDDKQSRH